MRARQVILAIVVMSVLSFPVFSAVNLTLGKAEGKPGDTVTIPLTMALAGEAPVGLSSNSLNGGYFTFNPAQMKFLGADKGAALQGSDVNIAFTEAAPGKITFQIMDNKLKPIPAGEIAVLKFTILKEAKCIGPTTLTLHPDVACADAETHSIPVKVADGNITLKCGPQEKK